MNNEQYTALSAQIKNIIDIVDIQISSLREIIELKFQGFEKEIHYIKNKIDELSLKISQMDKEVDEISIIKLELNSLKEKIDDVEDSMTDANCMLNTELMNKNKEDIKTNKENLEKLEKDIEQVIFFSKHKKLLKYLAIGIIVVFGVTVLMFYVKMGGTLPF